MTKKNKIIESEIQPNHKEAEVWIKPAKEDGTREVSYWNRKTHEWETADGGGDCSEHKDIVLLKGGGNSSMGNGDFTIYFSLLTVIDDKCTIGVAVQSNNDGSVDFVSTDIAPIKMPVKGVYDSALGDVMYYRDSFLLSIQEVVTNILNPSCDTYYVYYIYAKDLREGLYSNCIRYGNTVEAKICVGNSRLAETHLIDDERAAYSPENAATIVLVSKTSLLEEDGEFYESTYLKAINNPNVIAHFAISTNVET